MYYDVDEKKIENDKEFFWAFVIFYIPGKYGFVKRIHDFDGLNYYKLKEKNEDNYYIKLKDEVVTGEELVICSSTTVNSNKKTAKIEAVTHSGIVDRTKIKVLSSLLPATNVAGFVSDKPLTDKASFSSFTLHVTRNKDVIKLLPKPEQLPEEHAKPAERYFEKTIFKSVYSGDDVENIQALSSLLTKDQEKLNQYFEEAFDVQRAELSENFDEPSFEAFVKNWLILFPQFICRDNLNLSVSNNYYLDLWFKKILPAKFWDDELSQVFYNYSLEHPELEVLEVFLKFRNVLEDEQKDTYNQLLQKHCNSIESIDTTVTYISLTKLTETAFNGLSTVLEAELNDKTSAKTKLELWLQNLSLYFPHHEAISLFPTCSPVEQDLIIEQLNGSELLSVVQYLSASNSKQSKLKGKNFFESELLAKFNALALDIESDGKEINEFAWGDNSKWFAGVSPEEIKAVKQTLQNRIVKYTPLLIGHNIVDFDYPILLEQGLEIQREQLWDTMLVEMVLSPDLRTYALQTSHQALDDAKLASKVFINQVFRLLVLEEETWSTVKAIFEPKVQEILQRLRTSMSLQWIDVDELKEQLLTYFRPQPKKSSLLKELEGKLDASSAKVKVVLASSDFWDELRGIPGIEFRSSNSSYNRFLELDEDAFLGQLKEGYNQVLGKSFFGHCKRAGLKPMSVNLPPIVRIKLSEEVDFATSCVAPPEPIWEEDQIICLDVYELAKYEEDLLNSEGVEIFVVEPDLISLTFKVLLKELELSYIINNPVTEQLWIKFSGGQSFIELSKEQVKSFHIEIPDGLNNFWIEKYVYGQYRIWGNYNWENHLQGFPLSKIFKVEREKAKLPKDQASFVVVDQKKLQSRVGITRFNPETIYRSRYWLIQKELIAGIVSKESKRRPLILLVQRKDEVLVLEQYFYKLGYYIPNSSIALGRRLELLHQNTKSHKIIVAPVADASNIVSANYVGPLNFLFDSFNLYENYHLAKGSQLFENSITASAEALSDTRKREQRDNIEEDGLTNTEKVEESAFLQRDVYFLLKLQQPLINRLRFLLFDDNVDSKLWLLDARIEDFVSIGEEWNAKKEPVSTWDNKEEYDRDAAIVDTCILSPKPETELPFSLEKSKELLAKVFLSEGNNWYSYQHDYLNKILPAQTNLLVSLPTGGGKSLLFQAPALYRSSFTNRLTIVVTPLKALMEDQVKALWEKGFYGSVDYINQDKSDEVQQIYRRMAGGELSLLFITPERFRSGGFIKAFSQRFDNDGGLEYAVYDEAHCISQWGHEFRPDYLYSGKAVQRFKDMTERKFPVLLFSATVSEKIFRDFNSIFR